MQDMVEAIASGRMSAHGLAGALNARGLRTTRGNTWTAGAVVRVVTNPLHTGTVPIDRWVSKEPKKRKVAYPKRLTSSPSERPRDEWTTIERTEAIITLEQAKAVRAQLARNRRCTSRHNKEPYLLSSLMVCVNDHEEKPGEPCGRTLRGYHYTGCRHRTYHCSRRYLGDRSHVCLNRFDNADVIEAWAWAKVRKALEHPEELYADYLEWERTQGERQHVLERERDAAAAALHEAQEALNNLVRRHARGVIDEATFDLMQPELVQERDAARLRLDAATEDLRQHALAGSSLARGV
jgi:hypothetical protein